MCCDYYVKRMSLNRIQKLLFSEYCDFEDMVLVESPFAQTTREGLGLRQVQLGLTPTKLVLAIDVLPPVEDSEIICNENIDPEIETLELIAVYPVECVNLSVYRRRKRQSLKAHFCNNRVLYFELGGFEKRKMFWNLWCERIRFLCPEDDGSSVSETSVATSTSTSTLNIITATQKVSESGKPQFWCKFSKDIETQNQPQDKWVEQYLYLNEMNKNEYGTDFPVKKMTSEAFDKPLINNNIEVHHVTTQANPFKHFEQYVPAMKDISETSTEDSSDMFLFHSVAPNFSEMIENAVRKWEKARETSATRGRHPRRYGVMPQPHFLYGLGPWNIHFGDRFSTQLKRSVSSVRIRRQPVNPELNLSISKRLLTVSISCEAFHMSRGLNIDTCVSKLAIPGPKAIMFWTPEYWYRPQPAWDTYNEFLEHLRILKKNQSEINYKAKKKKTAKKKTKQVPEYGQGECYKYINLANETYLYRLRNALKIEVALTAWDFDSTTLAYQLTSIDKELFLKIKPYELQILVWQRSSKNTPNINSLIAFSHRISCLIVTEILRDDSDKVRARLIVRFINAADKCDRISNYQSCRTILSGLQSIPIYRLYKTWSYLRLHHAMKYQLFENLCRRYSDPRLLIYQESFLLATTSPPYLPYIGDILARLLDKVPPIPEDVITHIALELSHLKLSIFLEMFQYEQAAARKTNLDLRKKCIDDKQGKLLYSLSRKHKTNIFLFLRFLRNENQYRKLWVKFCDKAIQAEADEQAELSKNKFEQRFSFLQKNVSILFSHKIAKFFTSLKMWPTIEAKNSDEKEIKILFESGQDKDTSRSQSKNDFVSLKYEDNRIQRLQEVTAVLEICQKAAAKYALSKNDLAQEYLLKARYREDKENFYNFKLEHKLDNI